MQAADDGKDDSRDDANKRMVSVQSTIPRSCWFGSVSTGQVEVEGGIPVIIDNHDLTPAPYLI